MLKNYLKVAIRNLLKQKVFSFINIVGLAFGLCCAILISLWIFDELSYDKFHKKIDRLYITVAETIIGGESVYWANTPALVGPVVADNIAGIEATCRMTWPGKRLIRYENEKVEPGGLYVDSAFFELFTFPLAKGDITSALNDPYSIVITKKVAQGLFGNDDPIGENVTVTDNDQEEQLKVTGVLEDIPDQSILEFDYLIPFENYAAKRQLVWGNYNESLFLLLEEGADISTIKKEMKHFIRDHRDLSEDQEYGRLWLYPFSRGWLESDFSEGLENPGGRIEYVRIFSVVAIIIIVIACVNFMNLSTAKAGQRAKEVGIRKTTGARRGMLIFQFLSESVIIACISMVLAVTLADISMPLFNSMVEKNLSIPYHQPEFILVVTGAAILVGLLAGSYPALYISGFQPVQILKGAKHKSRSFGGIRRILVVFQFGLSIILISGTIIIYQQIQYVLDKDLGISKSNILSHRLNNVKSKKDAYMQEVKALEGVASVATSDHSPLTIGNSTWGVDWPGKGENNIMFHVIRTDEHFVETFDVELKAGNDFKYHRNDSISNYMLNEKAVKHMGLEDPVGQEITVWGSKGKVVGVVEDFHHQDLFKTIDPVIISQSFNSTYFANIKLTGKEVQKTIGKIGDIYSKYDETYPFHYNFIDQQLTKSYDQVITAGHLANVFAIVAIFISCLGLFGLTAYMTEQRTKETGIRKVFGASIFSLTTMFSKDFLKLVLFAFAAGVPVAYYLIRQWLAGFAFKIDMGMGPFILAGLSAVLIALLTVSYNTIKAAMANPVDSLKQE